MPVWLTQADSALPQHGEHLEPRIERLRVSTDTQKVLTADTKKSSLLGGVFPFVSTMGWGIAWGCSTAPSCLRCVIEMRW
jgi:hypothetical protein